MEKNLSLSFDETAALLEMTLFSSLEIHGDAADHARQKLSDLYRQFCREDSAEAAVRPRTTGTAGARS